MSILNQEGAGVTPENATQENATSDQTTGAKWNEGIDESSRQRVDKFKDVNGLAKGYIELESKLSEGFKMPETDEDKAKLYAKLGRPSESDGYELEGEDEIGFKEQAFQAGLSQDQVQSLSQWFGGIVDRNKGDATEARQQAEVGLRESWGGEYEGNLALANRALETNYSENLINRLDAGGFLDDREFISALHRSGKAIADDSIGSLPGVETTDSGQPYLDFPSMAKYNK